MAREMMVTGLDIGASKVSAVSARIDSRGAFGVLGYVTVAASGMARGSFFDLASSADAVRKALKKLRGKTARRTGDLYVGVSGTDVRGAISRGMIPLTFRGREVTRADMGRCLDVAGTVHLPFDREILHRIVQHFSVDDQPWIKNPVGLYASRLACEAYLITAGTNHIENIKKCVSAAGYDLRGLVYTGIADGAALLDAPARERGGVIIDMGASLTEVSVFRGGELCDMEAIPAGSADCAGTEPQGEALTSLLDRITERLRAAAAAHAAGTVVLTGGMAFEDGIVEALEARLGKSVKMGLISDIRGELTGLDGLRLATAVGLCRYAFEEYEKRLRAERDVVKHFSTKVVDLFNRYF